METKIITTTAGYGEKMNADKLQEILEKHKMYVNDKQGGVRADFRYADLCDADLCSANLRNADLRSANLRNADLRNANLRNANLRNADLCDADLCDADLRDADLCDADFRYADLCNADLCGADLRGADLCGAVGIISFGPIGKFRRIGYAVKHDAAIMIQLGCFWGTVEKANDAIRIKYGQNSTYEALVTAAANALSNIT